MIVTIHQPEHLPWLGLLHKIKHADAFVVLDTVPYRKNYFQNRNKILTNQGEEQWITVPVHHHSDTLIKDVTIDEGSDWRSKYWRSIEFNYSKHPHFNTYAPALKDLIMQRTPSLSTYNTALLQFLMEQFKITTPVHCASTMDVSGKSSELLLAICQQLKATEYLAGQMAKDYLDTGIFTAAGIPVIPHRFEHPQYPQLNAHGDFQPNLSSIDCLFNCGEKSATLI